MSHSASRSSAPGRPASGSTVPPGFAPRGDLATIRTLLPYLWPAGELGLRVRVVVSMVFLVLAKGVNVIVPWFYKAAVDALTGETGTQGAGAAATGDGTAVAAAVAVPVMMLVAYGVARVLAQAFGEARDAVFARVAQRAIRKAGLATFRHLHGLSLRFHLDRRTGEISRAIERGTKGIEFLLSFMLFNVLPTFLEIFMVCGVLWWMFGFWYAGITLLCIGGYIAWTTVVTEWRTKFRRQMNETDNAAHTRAIDSLLNFETVKYFGNEAHEARRFDEALAAYEAAAVKSRTSLSLLNVGQGVVIAVGLIVLMIMAANGVVAGTMTVGDFVLVNAYLIQLFMPLNFLGFVYREIKRSLTDMETMFSLLDQHPEVSDAPDATPLRPDGGALVFEDVSFAYDRRRPVIAHVSFSVPPGNTVAIVGPSGAGKSTISRLLYRFYDPGAGRILIDRQDIRQATQESVRTAIGIVPQDTVLFNDTIHYNIAYGRPSATPEEVRRAAQLARIHDFVASLPDGYATTVGERGLKLSGGEKQRVAIARAILKSPRILLFDEATSALDTHTEKEIQASLRDVSAGRTTVIIAHRLSTVVDADEILVLDHGRIVERGRHAELLARDGAYAAMWRRQQEAEVAREVLEHADEGDPLLPESKGELAGSTS
ncbi:MAG: ABC transporter ATP-binding protein/permease [Rhodospirillales bacterium]|nr:ABC transporter ATP-binding protein/permease [Rhodospirillales bacterium]